MAAPLSLKEKLHLYIETADEQKLQAIYTLLEEDINRSYSKEDIELFHQRRQNYLQKLNVSYSVEESLTTISKSSL